MSMREREEEETQKMGTLIVSSESNWRRNEIC